MSKETPYQLPTIGYVRLSQIRAVYPVGKSTWWAGVKDGRFPKSVNLGPRTTAWRVEDIRALIAKTSDGGTV
jgi:predicted DNA-binding transcriptional regulator AlpA